MNTSTKVYVHNGDSMYDSMYESRGYELVSSPFEADIVQFTGGEDVTPALYGEPVHPSTHNSEQRDMSEASLYNQLDQSVLKVGICRGSQFLNVVNGGSLIQDAGGHAIWGTHPIIIEETGETLEVTSTHHQQSRLTGKAKLIAYATCSTYKDRLVKDVWVRDDESLGKDVEAYYYPANKCLGVQFHPEFDSCPVETTDWFFKQVEKYL